jgi:CRP/FNR family transcriptional regulator, anaerobic regulatory protein
LPQGQRYALHRPELLPALERGEQKILELMSGERRTLSAGKTLVEADAEHPFVYRQVRGWTGRVRNLNDGRSQFILTFLPGDIFAVKSMFVNRHPDAIEALSDVIVEQIDHRRLREAYETDPDIAMRLTWQVVEEERRLHSWVVGLGRGSAEERLALLITELHGRLVVAGTIAKDALEFELPMTQTQLGDHLGLSAVHINRVLKTIRDQRIATLRGGRMVIHDLEALGGLADPLRDFFERTNPNYGGDPARANG